MGIKFANFATSTIADVGGISSSSSVLNVQSGDGNAKFPSITAGEDYFYCVLVDSSANREVIKVVARSGDLFAIERAQDGTTARAFAQGDKVELRLTKGSLEDISNHVQEAKTADYTVTAIDLEFKGKTFTNYGATAEVNFTLPAGVSGYRAKFIVCAGQYLRVTADGSEQFRMGTGVGAAGGYIRSNTIGVAFEIEYVSGLDQWVIMPDGVPLLADE